jgi:hypothetical protein
MTTPPPPLIDYHSHWGTGQVHGNAGSFLTSIGVS